ncbi:guanosine-5'-triphosphate,3'-diphosphate pyrophosphatase [bacterium BMS3Bbin02]|nr:guanosine-5'-triphosphate,3'-diphosphate pyrophosphatase [bacterium BMS3Bbin02]
MRVAAIDIGTNTLRLLIADVSGDPTRTLVPIARRTIVARLGRGVDSTKLIDPDVLGRGVAVLAGFADIIRRMDVGVVRAVATSAMRDAGNSDLFLEQSTRVLGVTPDIIDSDEEAALSFRGATDGLGSNGPVLVIDPGGGSTEFVLGTTEPEYTVSIDIGSVRITERHLQERPVPPQVLAIARSAVDELMARVSLPMKPSVVIGVGGTFSTMAALHLDLPRFDTEKVHRSTLTDNAIEGLVEFLALKSVEETQQIQSMETGRADVILGGSIVVERALKVADATEVIVSETGILHGLALTLAESQAS